MQSKPDIRRLNLARRLEIGSEEKKRFEARITGLIRNLPEYQKADVIALYYPVRGEVNLLSLMSDSGKVTVFPKVTGEDLAFYPAKTLDDFTTGCFGIPEPRSGEPVSIHDIDLIFVPGVCFDFRGHRLGYGKGYYDRLLQTNPDVYTIGVSFDECCTERLPVDPWDANVDCVVTQTGIFRSKCEVQ